MPKGISIHIGVDYVDKEHYSISYCLPHCTNDALAMQTIAEHNGFESCLLLNEDANSRRLFYALSEAAHQLVEGDILLLTFSGHGSFLKDLNGDEDDGNDEALLLYDRMIVDDQLFLLWTQFRLGVRILFICDSCHSGSVTKQAGKSLLRKWLLGEAPLDQEAMNEVYLNNKELYNSVLLNIPIMRTPIRCSILLLSACRDKEQASAGRNSPMKLSLFTEVVVRCWSEGQFEDYKDFYQQICTEMNARTRAQHPSYSLTGEQYPDFENQIPFTI